MEGSTETRCSLHAAISEGDHRSITTILDSSVDPISILNSEINGNSAVHALIVQWPTLSNDVVRTSCLAALLAFPGCLCTTNANGSPPLAAACAAGLSDFVVQLLAWARSQPSPTCTIEAPRNLAAALVSVSDGHGSTALHLVTQVACAAAVLDAAERPSVAANALNDSGTSPLMQLSLRGGEEAGSLAALLVQAGADVNAVRGGDGCRPLHIAAEQGLPEVVDVLLRHPSIDKDPRQRAGATPLYLAARNGHASVVRLLLASGADPCLYCPDGSIFTPIVTAASRGHVTVIRALTEGDRSAGQLNPSHPTAVPPLLVASSQGQTASVQALLDAGASFTFADRNGHTALHHAAGSGHAAIVALLVSRGAPR